MRIGMFTNCYPPSWGGLELSVVNLCKGLENAGHKTFVFAPQSEGDFVGTIMVSTNAPKQPAIFLRRPT